MHDLFQTENSLRLINFAKNTFFAVGRRFNLPDFLLSRWKDSENVKESSEVLEAKCTRAIQNLILSRLRLFESQLNRLEKYVELYKNEDDFYGFICDHTRSYFLYSEMNIFDKLSMSCAVVLRMSEFDTYSYTAPLSWAIYFEDELMQEFHAAGSWMALKEYAEMSQKGIQKRSFRSWQPVSFAIIKDFEFKGVNLYCFVDIIETYKRKVKRPLGSCCCPKCLPLYDILFYLSFGERNSEADAHYEGYMQLFLRVWSEEKLNEMLDIFVEMTKNKEDKNELERNTLKLKKIKVEISKLLNKRIFTSKKLDSSEEDCDDLCIFCGDGIETKNITYLKSIICRTAAGEGSSEKVLDKNEERRSLRQFLNLLNL